MKAPPDAERLGPHSRVAQSSSSQATDAPESTSHLDRETLTIVHQAVYEGFVRARTIPSCCAVLAREGVLDHDAAISLAGIARIGAVHLAKALELLEAVAVT